METRVRTAGLATVENIAVAKTIYYMSNKKQRRRTEKYLIENTLVRVHVVEALITLMYM